MTAFGTFLSRPGIHIGDSNAPVVQREATSHQVHYCFWTRRPNRGAGVAVAK